MLLKHKAYKSNALNRSLIIYYEWEENTDYNFDILCIPVYYRHEHFDKILFSSFTF